MTDPKRLLNSSPNRSTRELLRAGLEEAPPGLAKSRARQALGLGSIAGITATASSKAASGIALKASAATGQGALLAAPGAGVATKTLGLVVLKWVVLGALGGVSASGAAALVHSQGNQHELRVADQTARRNLAQPGAGGEHLPARVRTIATSSSDNTESPSQAMMPHALQEERSASRQEATHAAHPEFLSTPATRASAAAPEVEDTRARLGASPAARKAAARDLSTLESGEERPAPLKTTRSLTGGGALSDTTPEAELDIVRIDAARAALRVGDATRAMAELDRYEQSRKRGVLDREARLLRISALVLRGEAQHARELARRYVTEFPDDPHTTKLRELLHGTP